MTVEYPDMPNFRIKSTEAIREYWNRVYVPMIENSPYDKIVFSNEVLNQIQLDFFDVIKHRKVGRKTQKHTDNPKNKKSDKSHV